MRRKSLPLVNALQFSHGRLSDGCGFFPSSSVPHSDGGSPPVEANLVSNST
jgi:hypothetical protein